jgi:hypothetical protein
MAQLDFDLLNGLKFDRMILAQVIDLLDGYFIPTLEGVTHSVYRYLRVSLGRMPKMVSADPMVTRRCTRSFHSFSRPHCQVRQLADLHETRIFTREVIYLAAGMVH